MPGRPTFDCFGLVLHGYSEDAAVREIETASSHGRPTMVVTANPEILLHAKRNPAYWNVLRQADLRLVESFGLQLIGWLFGASPKRAPGVDFAERLLAEAQKRKWKVAFLGGENGAADAAAWKMRSKFPELSLVAEEGGKIENDGTDSELGAEARFRLTQFAPDVLLVAFGHPRQESWIVRHLAELPSVKVAIGVGGTFDFWSGKAKRGPKVFRFLGLEWLWRLFLEPRRWKRILKAVFVFPIVAVLDRVSRRKN